MKTKMLKSALGFMVGVLLAIGATSCDLDDPVNNGQGKNGEETASKMIVPARVEISIYKGHLHGVKKFHQNTHAKELKYLGTNYKLVYELKGNKWVASPENKTVTILADPTKGGATAVDIHYFDKDNHEITGRYITGGENQHYQHFFIAEDIRSGYGDIDKREVSNGSDFFDYEYCDTDPWNETNHSGRAKFVDAPLAVGMKGYFHFLVPYKRFNLEVRLMRSENNKLTDGKPSPFYAPTEQQIAKAEWLPSIVIPVNLYLSTADLELEADDYDNEVILTRDESEFSEHDRRVIHTLMDAFGETDFHKGVAEFFWNIVGSGGHDMDNFWF